MIRPKQLLSACLILPLFAPAPVLALEVMVQGIRLDTNMPGSSCVEIGGSYPGVKIVPSQSGKIPRICYYANRVNSLSILDTTFVAQSPIKKDITVKFEHEFPPGINGKVMARARLQGFFNTANGIGVPTGDQVSITPFFSQHGHIDIINEPFNLTVGDELETAMFEHSVKKQYLISGPRTLKGNLKLYFTSVGNMLTLADKNTISIDTGSTMSDKLDQMEVPLPSEEEGEGASNGQTEPNSDKKKAEMPGGPIPFPSDGGSLPSN